MIVNKNGVFIDTHVRYRTISDNLSKQEYKFLLTTTLTISDIRKGLLLTVLLVFLWGIPVCTGQITCPPYKIFSSTAYPRVYGADLLIHSLSSKLQGLIPVYTGQILNSSSRFLWLASRFFVLDFRNRTSMYHFRLVYFADNTFWSLSASD